MEYKKNLIWFAWLDQNGDKKESDKRKIKNEVRSSGQSAAGQVVTGQAVYFTSTTCILITQSVTLAFTA